MDFWKGLFASVLGALIGGLFALSFGFFWPVGVLLGGLTGYLAYDFPVVIAAAPRVWRETRRSFLVKLPSTTNIAWLFLGSTSPSATITGLFLGIGFFVQFTLGPRNVFKEEICALAVMGVMLLFIFAVIIAFLLQQNDSGLRDAKDFARHSNPFSATFWAVCGAGLLLEWVVTVGIPLSVKFMVELLKAIYLDARLVAGISALIGALKMYQGALKMYQQDEVLWGALFAISSWVIQYKIIHLPLKRRVVA